MNPPGPAEFDLEPIRRNGYDQVDRAGVEESIARKVETDPAKFIAQYIRDERSFGGRYISADLFKETFAEYGESRESRNRYNAPVHNSAAVLSAAHFRQVLAEAAHPERDTIVFLTGTPGAGKTSSVLTAGNLPHNYRAIFEGQLSDPVTTRQKIQQVLEAGYKPSIIVVHAMPEDALRNTLQRFHEEGRGASINVMSRIQGGLPVSLREIEKAFGQGVEFKVVDVRDRANVVKLTGWNNLTLLESEGDHEQIHQRLSKELERQWSAGVISEAGYRQARGEAPLGRSLSLGGAPISGRQADGGGRGIPQKDSEQIELNPDVPIGRKMTAPEYATALQKLGGEGVGRIELPKQHCGYCGKIIQASDTHIVQKIDKNFAIAHDITKIANGGTILDQVRAGTFKSNTFEIHYTGGRAVVRSSPLPAPVKGSQARTLAKPSAPGLDIKRPIKPQR